MRYEIMVDCAVTFKVPSWKAGVALAELKILNGATNVFVLAIHPTQDQVMDYQYFKGGKSDSRNTGGTVSVRNNLRS